MKVKLIEYDIVPRDLVNDCLDAYITLEDGSFYFVEVTTPEFLKVLMEEKKFLPPQYPYIIVSELTAETMRAAIEEFVNEEEDSYWLKLYHVTATLKIKDLNRILKQKKIESFALDLQITAEILLKSIADTFSDTKFIFGSISFLILGSFIYYCFF